MKNEELLQAIHALAKERGIDEEVLFEAIEEAIVAAFKREFSDAKQNEQVFAEIDRETGDMYVYEVVEVVSEVTNPKTQISLAEAKEIDPDLEEGDTIEMTIDVESLGRLAAGAAKAAISKKLRDTENDRIQSEFSDKIGELASGVIQRSDNRFVFVDIGRAEATLPRQEQVKDEDYSFNKRMKFLILRVETQKERPVIIVSRSHPNLVKKLLEKEVPEIHDGIVEIVSVAREAGSRSKVAVISRDPDVDPLGACVGQRGARIQAIMDELGNEKIDVIAYSDDPAVYISNALSPAKVERVDAEIITNEDGTQEKNAQVVVPDQQYSLAIGRSGQNVRLAARLTGWKIDIKSTSQFQQMVQNDFVANFTVADDDETSSEEKA
ncbi:MAG TPA: transcription termination/antitermination protein NusA [Clostridiales bacterium]|nr:transcription termination factor NusA [Saccharofermentanaceae bacterium]HAU50944.1 transcription termination/antitermination protein NusA [Clostridiales bacterium]HBY32619.1 transcription termination/antitermination protein NusA [Clostridiales bacterium]HBZ77186.1 transcription termination/antitermination protein NusA [Clostridiales bacterium]